MQQEIITMSPDYGHQKVISTDQDHTMAEMQG
jgi:hypothetical protein